jgi:geranylgeranyl reductase family protein
MAGTFDALIIGAGPAGSVAAIELARGGARVALVDRHEFPRDKTCGDALIPDALGVLERLALKDTALARARLLGGIQVFSPSGRGVIVRGECACIPRAILDERLRAAAIAAGASFFPHHRLTTPITEGAVRGAVFETAAGTTHEIRAETTILATGAAAEVLAAFDVCHRRTPSAIAARAYFAVPPETAREFNHLCISYAREICPGYGWLFPGPDDVFNVGVGFFYDAKVRPRDVNVRRLFERFVSVFGPARRLLQSSHQVTPLRGAPLRTALRGADLARPGLLVCGEAAGLTYSFSGEGIGKAMESGAIAARVVLDHARGVRDGSSIAAAYARRIHDAFGERFETYRAAQAWLARPRLIDLIAWRASRSRFVTSQLEGIFQEIVDPQALFSVSGFARALVS